MHVHTKQQDTAKALKLRIVPIKGSIRDETKIGRRLYLPNHLPEISPSRRQAALSGDVGLLGPEVVAVDSNSEKVVTVRLRLKTVKFQNLTSST